MFLESSQLCAFLKKLTRWNKQRRILYRNNLAGSVLKLNKENRMKSAQFDEMWNKTMFSLALVAIIIVILVAPMYESHELVRGITITGLFAFWVGAMWAKVWVTREMQENLSHPLPLIDGDGNLHPFMKVGGYYRVINLDILCTKDGGRIYLLHGRSSSEDGKIFCVQTAHDYVLPQGNFQVVRKTEDRGGGRRKTTFVFE